MISTEELKLVEEETTIRADGNPILEMDRDQAALESHLLDLARVRVRVLDLDLDQVHSLDSREVQPKEVDSLQDRSLYGLALVYSSQ